MAYDYSRYPAYFDVLSLKDSQRADGAYRVGTDGRKLDVLLQNFGNVGSSGGKVIVFFSGFVSNRASVSGPFFSGARTAKLSELPSICISDPVLELDSSLSLGWYGGYQGRIDLFKQIADVLTQISDSDNVEYLLVGGSGGGFASLCMAQYLNRKSSIFAFNPQTSIGRYWPKIVSRYLTAALGRPVEVADAAGANSVLNKLGVHHTVDPLITLTGSHEILYLQNDDDTHHIHNHLSPFVQADVIQPVGPNSMATSCGKVNVVLGNWGEQHARLPVESVSLVINQWAAGNSMFDCGKMIGKLYPTDKNINELVQRQLHIS